MYSLLLLAALAALTIRMFYRTDEEPDLILSSKLGGRVEKLWEIAHLGIVEQKYLRAVWRIECRGGCMPWRCAHQHGGWSAEPSRR